MAERDLDRYLEGIGIDVDGNASTARPPSDHDASHATDLTADEAHADDFDMVDDNDTWGDDTDVDFESALDGVGLGGVVPDDLDPDQRAETFLVQMLLYLDPTYAVDVHMDHEGTIHAEIHGGDSGRLIGKGGRTLAALEFLTHAVVNKNDSEQFIRVNVDVGGYKRRRDDRLRQVAQRAAARVQKSGMPVELEPMGSAERRVVHMALADDPTVESESTGEGRDRRVVVYPARAHD